MKKILWVFLLMSSVFFCCKKDHASGIPDCLQQRIGQIKSQPTWNPSAEIHEYSYNGEIVYRISANCCDQYEQLLDKNCNVICAPSGGIAGKGDGKCADFLEKAKLIRLVWKDER